MSNVIHKIESSVDRMKVLASHLGTFFSILLFLNCILFIGCLVLEIVRRMTEEVEPLGVEGGLSLISLFLEFLVYGAILFVMRGIALDISKRKSPFTVDHAKQIKVIAWLFVAAFIIGILNSPGFFSAVQVSLVTIGVSSDRVVDYPVLFLDFKSLIGAIVAFSLSSLWQYGTLLQTETDGYL